MKLLIFKLWYVNKFFNIEHSTKIFKNNWEKTVEILIVLINGVEPIHLDTYTQKKNDRIFFYG